MTTILEENKVGDSVVHTPRGAMPDEVCSELDSDGVHGRTTSLEPTFLRETGERRMSAEADLPPAEVKLRYMVCSLPRTGSSLITDALRRTGLAGSPAEYLNMRNISAYAKRFEQDIHSVRITEYLDFLEARRTTPNGFFGIKVHYEHFERLNRWFYKGYVRRFDRFVVVTRRNLVAQAISWQRAWASDIWNTDDPDAVRAAKATPVQFSRTALAQAVAQLATQEDQWTKLLADREANVLRVTYEDLTTDYMGTMSRIASHLGLPPVSFEPPRLQKLADALNSEWESRFVAEICGRNSGIS